MTSAVPRLSPALARSLLDQVDGVVVDKDGTLTDLSQRWGGLFASVIGNLAGDDAALHARLSAALGLDGTTVIPGGMFAVKSAVETHELLVAHLVAEGWDQARADEAVRRSPDCSAIGPLVPLGDMAGALRRLAAAGYRLGLATSDNRKGSLDELAELGIDALIETARFGDDEVRKPHPRVLTSIADEWGLDPARLLYVGDAGQDLACAEAAGTRFLAIGAPLDGADAWAHSLDELVTDLP